MKLETAFETVRILVDKGRGFAVTLHVSPEGDVTLEKRITIKKEDKAEKIAEQLIHQ
ncbi:MAG: hypothetical protein IH886_05350 [Nitrospinae bacterium]|nr:hypothetical protein [Nitrospinota bacterium]